MKVMKRILKVIVITIIDCILDLMFTPEEIKELEEKIKQEHEKKRWALRP